MTLPAGAVLLDTHAAIWFVEGRLNAAVLDALVRAGIGRGILVSPVSAWEIGLLAKPRPDGVPGLRFRPDPMRWFAGLLDQPGIAEAALTPAIAIGSSFLPDWTHRDPVDRLLVATARALGVPIVTRDRTIIEYAGTGHIAVVAC